MPEPPIQSPKNEQAHAPIKGYTYQSWLTVEAWLELGEGDLLYVEAAEDFAVFSDKNTAKFAQAKATVAPLTLRSDDAVEAINHFWAFRQKDSGYSIRYSFISTSPIGSEQGNPFDGIKGISLWQSAVISWNLSKSQLLLDFLVGDDRVSKKLDASLLAYLKGLSPEGFLEEILSAIIWDVNSDGIEGIKTAVRSQLGIKAEKRYGVSSAHGSNLSNTLFTLVNDIAASKEKIALTPASLHAALQEHLKAVNISVSSMRGLDALAGTLAGASGLDVGWQLTDITPTVELSEEFSLRDPALKTLTAKANNAQFVMIEGSSGMGKSVMAVIYAKSLEMDCIQFRSRETELPRILRGLQECIWLVANQENKLVLIIDDLPWGTMDAGGINILLGLSRTARKNGTKIVFTNQRAGSERELSAAGFSDMVSFKAPLMGEEEIIDLALRLGCPDFDLAKSWAPLVKLQALGHPQLVHAHMIALRRQSWPPFSGESYKAASEAVREEQSNVLLRLIDEREIELLTRLSAYHGTFKKKHAIAIAESLDRIAASSVTFEHLVGPWIEALGQGRYQITPILGRALMDALPQARQESMHAAVVESIISCQPIEVEDAAWVLLNAIEGKASSHASGLIMQFLIAPDEYSSALFAYLSWVQFIHSDGGVVFEGCPALDFIFRVLQFRVCAQNAPEKCEHFLTLCDQIIETNTTSLGEIRLDSILAVSIISSEAETIPFSRLFWANDVVASSLSAAIEEMDFSEPEGAGLDMHFESPEDGCDFMFSAKTWLRASNFDGLKGLLDFLRERAKDNETISRDLLRLSGNKALVLNAFDQVWLIESNQSDPNWEPLLNLYANYIEEGKNWGCDIFIASAAHSISVIHDEYLKDLDSASVVMEGLAFKDTEVQSIVEEQKGKVSLAKHDYKQAQIHFEASIAHNPWKIFTPSSILIAHHNAGYSAAKARDWEASANHFWDACELAKKDESWTRAVSFAADAAYSYWEFGHKEKAIDCFEYSLSMVHKMPSYQTDLLSLKVQKMLGNMLLQLNWCESDTAPNRELSAPIVPGMCSNLETIEALKDLPPPILDFEWAFLMNIEFNNSSSSKIWDKYSKEYLKATHPSLRYMVLELKARRCLSEQSESELLSVGAEISRGLGLSAKYRATEHASDFTRWAALGANESIADIPISLDSPYPVNFLLMCGFTTCAFRGDDPLELIDGWIEESVSGDVCIPLLDEWLGAVKLSYNQELADAGRATLYANTHWERWASALKLLASDAKHDPTTLLASSLALLLYGWHNLSSFEIADYIYRIIDNKLSELWKRACENRYAFRSPALYVSEIRDLACNPDGTVGHVAKLIVAVYPATDLNLPKEILDQIKELR